MLDMASKPESRKRIPLAMIGGGWNDTPSRYNRAQSEAKTQTNCRITSDGRIRKLSGRLQIATGLGGKPTGLICAPHTINVCSLSSNNKTLSIKYGGSAKTVTMAEGNYASYTALAAAMQTAINAQAGAGAVTVTYSTSTRLYTFTVTNGTSALILKWDATTTTLDKALFGFYHTVSTTTNVTSDFTLGYSKPASVMVACDDGKIYDTSKNEITFPNAVSVATNYASTGKWSGFYHLDKWYGTNQVKGFIFRDQYIRLHPDESKINVTSGSKGASAKDLYADATGTTELPMTSTTGDIVVQCGAGSTTGDIYALDKLVVSCRQEPATTDGFEVEVWWQVAGKNRRYLIDRIRAADITTSQANYTINIGTNQLESGVVRHSVPAEDITPSGYIIFHYSKGSSGFSLYRTGAGTHKESGADGVWTDATGVVRMTLTASLGALDNASACYHRMTLKNKDGFETKISGMISKFKNAAAAKLLKIALSVTDYDIMDVDTLVVYRSVCGNDNAFFKVCEIPIEMLNSGACNFYDGVSDDNIEYRPEADLINQWEGMPAGTKVVKWDNRAFLLAADAVGFVYYSSPDQPEKFNLATQYLAVGTDGSNIVDCVPYADRMMVLKNNSIAMMYPITSGYGVQPVADNAIGSVSAFGAISITSGQGAGIYFQAGDGHIYFSNGIQIKRLTEDRLEVFISGLNFSQLAKTVVAYDDKNKELIWSVCTGANTVPDTNIVYQILPNAWYKDTMPAEVWAWDYTSSGTSEVWLIGGGYMSSANKIYHREQAVSDLTAAIAMTWESADWDFGESETEKQAIGFTFYARKQSSSAQTVVVTNYQDGGSTEQTTGSRTLTTSFAEYWCPQSGRGRQYSFRIYNTDAYGWVEFIPLTFEYYPLGGLRRLQR
jgi:hypothetical protein